MTILIRLDLFRCHQVKVDFIEATIAAYGEL